MTIALSTWIAAGAIAAAATVAGVQTVRLAGEKAAHSATRAGYADERTKAAQAHARATDEQRVIYESRIGEKDAIITQAQQQAAQRATALADSRRVGDSLRDERAAYLARAGETCIGANASSGSPPGTTSVRLLDELFGEADRFAGVMAEAFEGSRDAGLACERSYGSLIGPATPAQSLPAPSLRAE